MNVLVFGIQGSGKSTHAKYIAGKLKVPYIYTGDLFRQIQKENSSLGLKVRKYMEAGRYVPDDLAIAAFENYLSKVDVSMGVVLDGFPRTLNQVEALKLPIDLIININLDEEEAIARLIKRGRPDDTDPGSIRSRIDHFKEKTAPILSYYKEHGVQTIKIDNSLPVGAVRKKIDDLLKKYK